MAQANWQEMLDKLVIDESTEDIPEVDIAKEIFRERVTQATVEGIKMEIESYIKDPTHEPIDLEADNPSNLKIFKAIVNGIGSKNRIFVDEFHNSIGQIIQEEIVKALKECKDKKAEKDKKPDKDPNAEPDKDPNAEPDKDPNAEHNKDPNAEPNKDPKAEPVKDPKEEPVEDPMKKFYRKNPRRPIILHTSELLLPVEFIHEKGVWEQGLFSPMAALKMGTTLLQSPLNKDTMYNLIYDELGFTIGTKYISGPNKEEQRYKYLCLECFDPRSREERERNPRPHPSQTRGTDNFPDMDIVRPRLFRKCADVFHPNVSKHERSHEKRDEQYFSQLYFQLVSGAYFFHLLWCGYMTPTHGKYFDNLRRDVLSTDFYHNERFKDKYSSRVVNYHLLDDNLPEVYDRRKVAMKPSENAFTYSFQQHHRYDELPIHAGVCLPGVMEEMPSASIDIKLRPAHETMRPRCYISTIDGVLLLRFNVPTAVIDEDFWILRRRIREAYGLRHAFPFKQNLIAFTLLPTFMQHYGKLDLSGLEFEKEQPPSTYEECYRMIPNVELLIFCNDKYIVERGMLILRQVFSAIDRGHIDREEYVNRVCDLCLTDYGEHSPTSREKYCRAKPSYYEDAVPDLLKKRQRLQIDERIITCERKLTTEGRVRHRLGKNILDSITTSGGYDEDLILLLRQFLYFENYE